MKHLLHQSAFDHERLEVYRLSIDFVVAADDIVGAIPRGRGYLGKQLQRAALSVALNIAEGAGKFGSRDQASFYSRARGSAMECAAILDVCGRLDLASVSSLIESKRTLKRITQMLTKLIQSCQ